MPSIKEVIKARVALAKDTVSEQGKLYHNALKFQDDKQLRKWYDSNMKGRKSSEAADIIQRGFDQKEISGAQGILLMDLLESTEESL